MNFVVVVVVIKRIPVIFEAFNKRINNSNKYSLTKIIDKNKQQDAKYVSCS